MHKCCSSKLVGASLFKTLAVTTYSVFFLSHWIAIRNSFSNPVVQWFSEWAESPPLAQFWGARGRTKQRGRCGEKTTQRWRKRPMWFLLIPHDIWLKRDFRLWPQCSQSKETACWFISAVIYDSYLSKMSPNILKLCECRQAHPSHWTGDHGMYWFLQINFF